MHKNTSTLLILALLASGCASGITIGNPNPEKSLRKTPAQFAQYAKQHVYPAEAPKGGKSPVRGEVDYDLDVINLVNLGEQDWPNVDVWVNGRYVCPIASLPVKQQKGINFSYFYDTAGMPAPSRGTWIEKVELFYNGQLYDITMHPAD